MPPFGHTFRVEILHGARLFLTHLQGAGLIDPSMMSRPVVTPILIADGRCASDLDAAIPVLLHRRLSSLPRYLSADDVERVIASCDRASAVGQRDRAILLLLARLGLRAGDIVQLRLADLDWQAAWIHVAGKGRRETRLPLTREVGEALVTYLTRSRPPTDTETVFVRSRAPYRAFGSHCAVSVIVDRAFGRAGVIRPSRGAAHLLRHSVATSMLSAVTQ